MNVGKDVKENAYYLLYTAIQMQFYDKSFKILIGISI